MVVIKYICTGTCGGMVTEAQFKAGKNKCATKGCTQYGKLLRKKIGRSVKKLKE